MTSLDSPLRNVLVREAHHLAHQPHDEPIGDQPHQRRAHDPLAPLHALHLLAHLRKGLATLHAERARADLDLCHWRLPFDRGLRTLTRIRPGSSRTASSRKLALACARAEQSEECWRDPNARASGSRSEQSSPSAAPAKPASREARCLRSEDAEADDWGPGQIEKTPGSRSLRTFLCGSGGGLRPGLRAPGDTAARRGTDRRCGKPQLAVLRVPIWLGPERLQGEPEGF